MVDIDTSDLSIVIPFRTDHGRREQLFRWCVDRWRSVAPDAAIVLGTSPAPVFSRSEAINNALAQACERPLVLIADADHVVHEEWLAQALETVRLGAVWCVPQVHCFLLEQASDRWLRYHPGTPAEQLPGFLPSDVDWFGYTGRSGLVLVTAEQLHQTRGFDERFDGWGLQDVGFACALAGFGWEMFKSHWCGHLWHPKNEAEPGGVGQEWGNWDLFRRYEAIADAAGEPVVGAHAPRLMADLVAEPGHDRGWWQAG